MIEIGKLKNLFFSGFDCFTLTASLILHSSTSLEEFSDES